MSTGGCPRPNQCLEESSPPLVSKSPIRAPTRPQQLDTDPMLTAHCTPWTLHRLDTELIGHRPHRLPRPRLLPGR